MKKHTEFHLHTQQNKINYNWSNYVILYIGDLFNIEILSTEFYNIFDKQLNFSLIIRIIID